MNYACADYRTIFLSGAPLIDVRAPLEFHKGAFPHAVNLPLMNDSERQQVGTCFREKGQDAAIALGERLVSGGIKAERIAQWSAHVRANPGGYFYCARGGLRSQISQQWLQAETGIDYPRIAGGYKAMRAFLIQTIEAAVSECEFIIVGGLTGCGKTDLLKRLDDACDLEGHAHHRGSSFGKHAKPQPTQVDFENALAIDFLVKRAQGRERFVLEDESRLIGSCSLPLPLYKRMQESPVIWIEDSLQNRVDRILRDYIIELRAEFVSQLGEAAGLDAFGRRLEQSLANIAKRLGGERYQRLSGILSGALAQQERSGSVDAHRQWIEPLLAEYYDPIYADQQQGKAARIRFRGTLDDARALIEASRPAALT